MSIGKSTSPNSIVPLGNEGNIKVVEHFKYLGAFASANDTNFKELNNIIGKAAGAFRELEKVWKDWHLNLDIKMKFYNSCVLSTLLYAAECWSLCRKRWGQTAWMLLIWGAKERSCELCGHIMSQINMCVKLLLIVIYNRQKKCLYFWE